METSTGSHTALLPYQKNGTRILTTRCSSVVDDNGQYGAPAHAPFAEQLVAPLVTQFIFRERSRDEFSRVTIGFTSPPVTSDTKL
jgi:hypothetical protein